LQPSPLALSVVRAYSAPGALLSFPTRRSSDLGARPENLVQLQTDYPHLKVVKLEQNYRSTGRILRAANTVIANNGHVFEKQLWRSEEHTSELQSRENLVCRLLLEKKKTNKPDS